MNRAKSSRFEGVAVFGQESWRSKRRALLGVLLTLVTMAATSCGDVSGAVIDANNNVIDAPISVVDSTSVPDAVEQCVGGRGCVPAAPTGWTGPGLFYEGAANIVAPACPSEYPAQQDNFQNLTAGGTCDCECGSATGVSCDSVVAWRNGSNVCNDFPDVLGTFSANVCRAASISTTSNFIEVGNPQVSGGSCVANTLDTLQTPSFQTINRTCDGASLTPADCGGGDVCAPDPTAGFQAQLCITMPGEGPCPTGSAYDQKTLVFGSFVDNRTCGACGCGTPSGSCSGSITFIDDCNASLPTFFAQLGTGSCMQVNAAAGGGTFTPTPNPSGTCAPTAGTVNNAAAVTGAVTICCLP